MQVGRLYGLGIGPGDPELLTLKAYRLLRSANVVAYPCSPSGASVARSIVSQYLQSHQIELPFELTFQLPQLSQVAYDQAAQDLAGYLRKGQDVVVLCEGDPLFYGTFMYLLQRLRGAFPIEVIPGVSSVMASAARLAIPLTSRNDVFTVLSALLPSETLKERLLQADAAVILKVGKHFSKIHQVLQDLALLERARYIEYATAPQEQRWDLSQVDPETVPYFSMIVIPSANTWLISPPQN